MSPRRRLGPGAMLPQHYEMMWPTLEAIRELGGSATIQELDDTVIQREGFTEVEQSILHGEGPETELVYRLAWSRTYLRRIGALENSARGVWSITDRGRDMDAARVREEYRHYRVRLRRANTVAEAEASEDEDVEEAAPQWRDLLLEALLAMEPSAFERLAQRLLREAGFSHVQVTGKSGDGGIDGIGTYRLSLVSFPTFFQCKRFRGSVSPSAVRDFRGAMAGRGEKGLLITTGSFTRDAVREATRDGAPPIELIDGNRLCDLLKEYSLGVRTIPRIEEDVFVDSTFFAEL